MLEMFIANAILHCRLQLLSKKKISCRSAAPILKQFWWTACRPSDRELPTCSYEQNAWMKNIWAPILLMIPFLTVLDKCQYIASFWMLFSIWERPCVQKEMIKPNSKYVHITGYSWIKYQEKIYSLGDHSGNGKVTILRRQKKLLKFWEDGHGQYILTETIVESLMSIQWRVLNYWADILYVPSMKIS